jgi:hypothetical protein
LIVVRLHDEGVALIRLTNALMANQANVDINIHRPNVTRIVHQMFCGRFIILAGRPIIVPFLPLHLIIDPPEQVSRQSARRPLTV